MWHKRKNQNQQKPRFWQSFFHWQAAWECRRGLRWRFYAGVSPPRPSWRVKGRGGRWGALLSIGSLELSPSPTTSVSRHILGSMEPERWWSLLAFAKELLSNAPIAELSVENKRFAVLYSVSSFLQSCRTSQPNLTSCRGLQDKSTKNFKSCSVVWETGTISLTACRNFLQKISLKYSIYNLVTLHTQILGAQYSNVYRGIQKVMGEVRQLASQNSCVLVSTDFSITFLYAASTGNQIYPHTTLERGVKAINTAQRNDYRMSTAVV